MAPSDSVTIPHSEFAELMTKVALIKQDTEFMREEAKNQRTSLAALDGRVQVIERERIEEKSIQKGRTQMAKLLWGAAVTVAGMIGGMVSMAINAIIKLSAH